MSALHASFLESFKIKIEIVKVVFMHACTGTRASTATFDNVMTTFAINMRTEHKKVDVNLFFLR